VLEKLPEDDPSVVCAPEAVGFVVSLQQRPLTVTGAPPFEVIFPPETAVVKFIEVTVVVVRVATTGEAVVNWTSFP
jgi:hypothetical protein